MGLLGRPTLQKRISLLVLAFLVLVLVLFGWLGVQSLNESAQGTLEERLAKARVVAGYLDEDLKHILSNVEDYSDFGGSLPGNERFKTAAERLTAAAASLDIATEAVFLVGADGRVVLSEPPQTGIAGIAQSDDDIVASLRKGRSTISDLSYTPVTRVPVVFASAPVRDSSGAIIGSLSIAINVARSSISNIIKPIALGDTGYAEIVDRNGVVMARTDPGRRPGTFELSDHPDKFAMLIAEGRATVRTCHNCHGTFANPQRSSPDVIAFAPLQNAAWGVAIRQSETEAFAIRELLKRRFILLGGIVVVGAFLLVWVVTQGVVRPVRALTQAAGKMAGGDFKAFVPVKGKDEIGQLGVSFAEMTRQLEKAREELISRNRELSSLNSIAATVGQSLDLDEVLAKSLRSVVEVAGATGGCIALVHGESKEPRVSCRLGAARIFDCAQMPSPEDCACHQVVLSCRSMLVNGPEQCPALARQGEALDGVSGFASIPLKSKDRALGLMNLCYMKGRYFTEQEFKLLDAIGNYIGLAVENAVLYREAKEKEVLRGQLLGATIAGQEDERKRLARELHDEFGQTLTGLIMGIEAVESSVTATAEPRFVDRLANTRLITMRALQDLRNLIRGLRSSVLDDLGLVAAIRSHAEERLESAGIRVEFRAEGMGQRLPAAVETSLFRIAQEAINNILRHAKATAVTIVLRMEERRILMMVSDNGKGFDTEVFFARRDGSSLGIIGMRERALLLGGSFSEISEPGRGTRVTVEVPLEKTEPGPERAGEQEVVRG